MVECLLENHKNWSSYPQHPSGEEKEEDLWGPLAGNVAILVGFTFYEKPCLTN